MSDERTWNPGDSPVLPDADEACNPPDAVALPLDVAETADELQQLFDDSDGFGERP